MTEAPQTQAARGVDRTCAECHRLRIQCDKQIPCRSCVVCKPKRRAQVRSHDTDLQRRRCDHLCPDGRGITAQGTRAVLAATEDLHSIVGGLRDRIRALETALNEKHLDRTGHTHPMLSSAQLDQETPGEICNRDTAQQPNPMQAIALVRGRDGASRIAAAHGKIWISHLDGFYPMSRPAAMDAMIHERKHYPGVQMRRFPFSQAVPVPHDTVAGLQKQLPPADIMNALLDVFQESAACLTVMSAFTDHHIRHVVVPNATSSSGGLVASAGLSSLFAVLALGSLFAVDGAEVSEVAQFADLSAVALAVSGVLSCPSLELVEALFLRAVLELFRQGEFEEIARATLALALRMCISLGLHLDGTAFGLRPEISERRRVVFWMVHDTDLWENLCVGRPAVGSFITDFVDTQIPGRDTPSSKYFFHMRQMVDIIAGIVSMTVSLVRPSYRSVLDMDARVRALAHAGVTTPPFYGAPLTLLLYVHRAFYACALIQHGDNLFESEYHYSVQATIRSARDTMLWAKTIFDRSPAMCARIHWIWSILVTTTMVFKAMLEQSPRCEYAPVSRAGFELALRLFEIGSKYGSYRARQALAMFETRSPVNYVLDLGHKEIYSVHDVGSREDDRLLAAASAGSTDDSSAIWDHLPQDVIDHPHKEFLRTVEHI